jgi:large subunit ribosomal protein L30
MPSLPKLRVTWTKSVIGAKARHRATVRALGFHRLHQTVFHDDTPSVRGMLHAVRHLVLVAPATDEEVAAVAAAGEAKKTKAPSFTLVSGPTERRVGEKRAPKAGRPAGRAGGKPSAERPEAETEEAAAIAIAEPAAVAEEKPAPRRPSAKAKAAAEAASVATAEPAAVTEEKPKKAPAKKAEPAAKPKAAPKAKAEAAAEAKPKRASTRAKKDAES